TRYLALIFTSRSPCPTFLSSFPHSTPTPPTSTLSLHDALPILPHAPSMAASATRLETSRTRLPAAHRRLSRWGRTAAAPDHPGRSEEHTSELQSRVDLVCRLLLEKKKKRKKTTRVARRHKSNDE